MADQMYFGCRGNMKWIPCPKSDADLSLNRYTNEQSFHRGAQGLYQSAAGAKTYTFDFGLKHAADIQHLLNVDMGFYGSPIYFLDPFAMKTNVLPIHWSAPFLAAYRAPSLMGKTHYRQALTATDANDYGYPSLSAVLGLDAGNDTWVPANSLDLWIPVPAGYTFHFGAHSTTTATTNPAITLTPDGGSTVNATLLANTTSQLTNYTYTPGSNSGITLKMGGTNTAALIISGMIAQILKVGQPAPTGSFIAGRGHSGCKIPGGIKELGVSAAMDWEQYTGVFKEYGNWNG